MADSATILFTCEACGVQGRVPESFRGKTARCPSCKHVQIIPMDAPSPPVSGSTERMAKPTITRSFAAPRGDDPVSDETRSRALLGIVERLEKVESLNERLHGSMQRLQTQSHAGDEDTDQRLDQLQSSLTQTQHTVTGLLHTETRLDAMGKKLEILQRAANRSDQEKQFEEIFEQLKRQQRQLDSGSGPSTGAVKKVDLSPVNDQLSSIEARLAAVEEQALSTSEATEGDKDPGAAGAQLDSVRADLSNLRTELEEQLARLSETQGQNTDTSPEIAQMSEGLSTLEMELKELRATVTALPATTGNSAAPAKSNPALAVLALLIALGGAGFAGFILTQVNELKANQATMVAATEDKLNKQAELISYLESSTNSALEAQKSTIETANSLAGNANSLAGKAMITAEEGKTDLATLESESNQSIGSLETKLNDTINQLKSNQESLLSELNLAQQKLAELQKTPDQVFQQQLAELRQKINAISEELEDMMNKESSVTNDETDE